MQPVSEGQVLTHSSGKTLSHVILCGKGADSSPTTQPSTLPTTSTTELPSQTAGQTVIAPPSQIAGQAPPVTGPVIETDEPGRGQSSGRMAGFAVLVGGMALSGLGVRRAPRRH